MTPTTPAPQHLATIVDYNHLRREKIRQLVDDYKTRKARNQLTEVELGLLHLLGNVHGNGGKTPSFVTLIRNLIPDLESYENMLIGAEAENYCLLSELGLAANTAD